ncbi:MAG TPA: ribosome recycling factor [Myxococcales bacterium]|nr:ribosome recycling factor [Myxococcales bacterium]HBU48262.1 ribosome recycling factor [Myxococcales bacterium]
MVEEVLEELHQSMSDTVGAIKREMSRLRTGRANPSVLDGVRVEYYGTTTPLSQLAGVSAPEPRLLVVKPWDNSAIGDIEKALLEANLGLTPQNDGEVIRLTIPVITEERRRDFAKQAWEMVEQGKVSIRNKRRDGNDLMKAMEKDGDISEDDCRRALDRVQKVTDEFTQKLDELGKAKEEEILSV